MLKKILQEIHDLNRCEDLFRRGDRILLAVSGGADSMILLRAFCALRRSQELSLAAAFVDHGLQRRYSAKAWKAVREECARLGIPSRRLAADVRERMKKDSLSPEDACRRERYALLTRQAKRLRCQRIATAHNRDDQAETILLRITRGTGLKGLSGIPVKRAEGDRVVIRPLLGVSRALIRKTARHERIPIVEDPSNRSDAATRNRIRNRLLPWMRRHLNPSIDEALLSLHLGADRMLRWVERDLKALEVRCLRRTRQGLRLDLRVWQKAPEALGSEALGSWLREISGSEHGYNARQRRAAEALLRYARPGERLSLSGGVCLHKLSLTHAILRRESHH